MPHPTDPIETFILRWDDTERTERANYLSFPNEFCAILGVPPPPPASFALGDYRNNTRSFPLT
jgi:hypothetical protein